MKENLLSNTRICIFDMDGTLYQLDGIDNGYKGSSLERKVNENAIKFISETENINIKLAKKILNQELTNPVGISVFLSQRYQITRSDYFNVVWDIDPNDILKNFETPVKTIKTIKGESKLILLTSAPKVWQEKVINYLELQNIFEPIFTGEDFTNKGQVFQLLSKRFPSANIISVGDQEKTDIIPAREFGIKGFLVRSPNEVQRLLTNINL